MKVCDDYLEAENVIRVELDAESRKTRISYA